MIQQIKFFIQKWGENVALLAVASFLSLSPSSSKARLNGPWYKNLRNHKSLLFTLFHNPQPCTPNSPTPSCSSRLSNPTRTVSSSRSSLSLKPVNQTGFSQPSQVTSSFSYPLLESHDSYWSATIESAALIPLT
jgi:hypothetical protein